MLQVWGEILGKGNLMHIIRIPVSMQKSTLTTEANEEDESPGSASQPSTTVIQLSCILFAAFPSHLGLYLT